MRRCPHRTRLLLLLTVVLSSRSVWAASPSVDVGSDTGFPGAVVKIEIALVKGMASVVATSNDIAFDQAMFTVAGSGACTINPAISGPPTNQQVSSSTVCTSGQPNCTADTDCSGGAKCNVLRVGTYNLGNSVVPDGLVATCTFTIMGNAAPKTYTLANVPGAADASGDLSGVTGSSGSITVLEQPIMSPTSTPTPTHTDTPTPTRTEAVTATLSPSPTTTPPCIGDCNMDSRPTIDDIITLVNIALGTAQPSACPEGIPSGAEVNVALIVQAVNNALSGCGAG
jgi:hypothetical protein